MKVFKIAILIFVISIFTLTRLPLAGAQEMKIGYVNLGETFDEYEKTQQDESALEKKGEKKEKERQNLVDEIKKLKEEMVLLSDKGKVEKQDLIDEKIKELQEFDKGTRDELRRERDDMVRDILREINNVIQDYGKENDYTVILNDRVIIYGNETINITQDIVSILNKKKR